MYDTGPTRAMSPRHNVMQNDTENASEEFKPFTITLYPAKGTHFLWVCFLGAVLGYGIYQKLLGPLPDKITPGQLVAWTLMAFIALQIICCLAWYIFGYETATVTQDIILIRKGVWSFTRNKVVPLPTLETIIVKMEPKFFQYFGMGGNLTICHKAGTTKFGTLLEENVAENLQDTLLQKAGITDY